MYANILGSLMARLPVYLVWLAGIIAALVFWRRHPRVSLLAISGFLIMLLTSVVGGSITAVLPQWLVDRGVAVRQIGPILFTKAIIESILHAVAMGLLVGAIFGWRTSDRPHT